MRKRSLRPFVPVLPLLLAGGATTFAACGNSPTTSSPSPVSTVVDASAGTPDTGLAPFADHVVAPYDAPMSTTVPRAAVVAEMVSQQVDTQGLLFSAGEMQVSGEPFAEFFAGRNLNFYDRTYLPPDEYLVAMPDGGQDPLKDLFGFSTAVESYEYSKYYMNMIAQETGAGLSLANGPILATMPGATAEAKLITRLDHLLQTVGNDVAGFSTIPPPVGNPRNVIGFGGWAPEFAPYSDFDSTMAPTTEVVTNCDVRGGYGGIPSLGNVVPVYECEYNELNVPDAQLHHVLVPAVLGYATWKEALWAMDFAGPLHDSNGNPVATVASSDMPLVGQVGNTVVGTDMPGEAVGTYIGSTPLEGMWGMSMLEYMDNLSEFLVSELNTGDGATLSGIPKPAAIAYDYDSPLRWFPAAVDVSVDATQTFPPVQSMTIADATSRSEDLGALLLGEAMFFAITDPRNPTVGQRIGLELSYDGDPFPPSNAVPTGADTAHDRSLSVLRLAFVDLDRIHADPTLGVLVDSATLAANDAGGVTVTPGNAVSTTSLTHAIIGMTQTLLSLNAAVTQYGGANPDPSTDEVGILNTSPIHPAGFTGNFSQRVRQVLETNTAFVRDVLTSADGTVANGATLAAGKATTTTTATTLDAQAAAIRALAIGFQITGDETYLTRGRAVVQQLFTSFWSPSALMFRETANGPDQLHLTPRIWGLLQSALRETHKVLYLQDDPVLGRNALEPVIARIMKLYMNGWDDLDGNQTVDHGGQDGGGNECLGARMEMGEQSLTGELGRDEFGLPVADRDGDCVSELAHAGKGSLMAGEVYFHSP